MARQDTAGRRWQRTWAFLFGFLGPFISGWVVYAIVMLWPRLLDTATSPTVVRVGFGLHWLLDADQAFLVLSVLGGVLGGLVYTMGLYASRRSAGKFRPQDANWYWVRCVVGAGLGLSVYVLLRSGLFLLGSAATTSGGPTPYTVLSVTLIVGLFTDRVLRKLSDLAGNFFSTKEELAGEHALARPTIQTWSPTELTRGVAGQRLRLGIVGGDKSARHVTLNEKVIELDAPGSDGVIAVTLDEEVVSAVQSLTVRLDGGDGSASTVVIPVVEPVVPAPVNAPAKPA